MKTIVFAALFILVMSLSSYSQKGSGVFMAVRHNDSTAVGMCLNAGFKANATSMGGNTLLMEASRNGSYASARLLLSHGAKVNAKDEMGNTALMEAAWKGDVTMASLLLQAGANAGTVNKAGQTALSLATDANKTVIIQLLSGDAKYTYAKQR